MSQTRAAFTRRARFALPIGGRSDAGRADRALTPLFAPLFFLFPCSDSPLEEEGCGMVLEKGKSQVYSILLYALYCIVEET